MSERRNRIWDAIDSESAYRAVIHLLTYSPDNGILIWNDNAIARLRGKVAGRVCKQGYVNICYKRRRILAHRVVWRMVYGEYPNGLIDHINGNKSDNRIINLRVVDYFGSNMNKSKTRRNTSGFKGVSLIKKTGRWHAVIKSKGVTYHIGNYSTAEEAAEAYRVGAEKHHGEYART